MNLRVATVLLIAAVVPAHGDDFIVYAPTLMPTQTELELRGYVYADARPNYGGNAAELSIAHAFTDWWKPEIYVAKYENAPSQRGGLKGYEFENTFRLTEPGKYWADVGFLASYERKTTPGIPDAVEFGPLLAKADGRFEHIVNLIWEKEVGAGADGHYALRYSYSGTYAASKALRPGVEFYGRPGDHAYQVGPIMAGEWHVPGTTGNLEYRVGVVLGINAEAPRQTWLTRLEYEFF